MARTNQRKLWIVEVLEKGRWWHVDSGGSHADRESMLNALESMRHQYPDEKYKLTTYVPKEAAVAAIPWPKPKPKRRKR